MMGRHGDTVMGDTETRRLRDSPRLRVSASPRLRVSASPCLRFSVSPRLRVSVSPRLRVSASPLLRVSASPSRFRFRFTVNRRECILGCSDVFGASWGVKSNPTVLKQDQFPTSFGLVTDIGDWQRLPEYSWERLFTDSYRRSHPKFHSTTMGSESV